MSGTRVEGQDRQACESRDLLGNVGCWHIRSDCCSRVRANDAAINSRLFQHFGSLLFFVRINRCKFKGRPSSNFKESILVLEALFTIAFRNVQWNWLRRTQPFIPGVSIRTAEGSCDLIRERNVLDRDPTHVEAFIIESRLWHQRSFRVRVPLH